MNIPKKHFYMIRHGQTEANAQQLQAGWEWDTPLTQIGRKQASDAQQILNALPVQPKHVIHSHLSRTKDTASILNQALNLPMTLIEDVGEQKSGEWHGQPWSETRHLVERGINPPGGETHEEFSQRVHRGISSALNRDAPVLIVCHGGVFRGFCAPFGVRLPRIENCVLYEFEPGDTGHAFPWRVFHYDTGVRIPVELEIKSYYAASA